MSDRLGQQLGNYRLISLLGQGGYAEVYLGQHVRFKQQAAIKVLHTHLSSQEVEHFLHEAETIAALAHPAIVRVFDFDVQDGVPFLVMDYAPNGSLRRRYPKGTVVPLPQILSAIKQVAAALQYAHEQKFIHRDVKPENMLVGRQQEVLLSDFGLAALAHSSASLSTQEAVGTLSYMAPEQIEGHPRVASDQYALGVVVYEWLCGARPFEGSMTEVMVQQLTMPPPPLHERVATIPPELEQVVLRALAKDPKARFASVQDFAMAFERASQLAPGQAVPLPAEQPAPSVAAAPRYTTVAVLAHQLATPTEATPAADRQGKRSFLRGDGKGMNAMESSVNRPPLCPKIIGRISELAALRLLVEQAKGGQGQIALIAGEAGIGKSRLTAEIKIYATAQGFQLLQGNCFPADLSCPYAPLLDLLRSYLATSATATIAAAMGPVIQALFPLLPASVSLLPDLALPPPQPPLDSEQEKRRLFMTLAHFFTSQAAQQPLLLVVEDLHWSDDISLEFLHYLVRRCPTQPLLLLVTYRSDEVHPSLNHWLAQLDRERLAPEVSLARLTRSDVAAMLRAILGVHLSVHGELLDIMYAFTEGNPFFVEEILTSLITMGELVQAKGTWTRKPTGELRIPRSVQDAVQQRTDSVSEAARQVLLLAAVAGRRFNFALLQHLMQQDEHQLLQLLKELIAAQLVVEESAEQFAFRHALTQQAVYAELLVRERKILHRTIAVTMEHLYAPALDAHLADLASHFYEAGVWTKALEYAQRAGERAQSLYASRTAIEHYTQALDAARHLALVPPPTLYRARGQAYETLGAFEQARADYEQALDAARDGMAEWQSLTDLGLLWAGRDYERAGVFFRRALDLAQALGDPTLHAHSLNRLGNWHLNVEQPLEALRYHQEALTMFQQVHDRHGLAETLDLLGMTSYLGGDLLRGTTYSTNMMVAAATSLAEVIPDGEMALKIARETGQRPAEAYALCLLGECLGSQGEYTRALEAMQEGLAIAEDLEHRQWMIEAHCALGPLYLDLLALSAAQQHLTQALALAHELGSQYWTGFAAGYLASTSILLRDLAQAESVLTTVSSPDTPAQTLAQRLVWCARAELALASGKPSRALAITDQLIAFAPNISARRNMLRVSKLRGEALAALHREAEAETALQIAREIAAAQGARPMLWRICVDLGHLYHTQACHAEANQAFATARTLIEELVTTVPDDRVRHNFLCQATAMLPRVRPLSPNRAAKQAFGGLTAREREVATLIAQGKSNREIADALVVSYRTVETHVGTILSKLSLTSRAQIAVWALERALVKHSE